MATFRSKEIATAAAQNIAQEAAKSSIYWAVRAVVYDVDAWIAAQHVAAKRAAFACKFLFELLDSGEGNNMRTLA